MNSQNDLKRLIVFCTGWNIIDFDASYFSYSQPFSYLNTSKPTFMYRESFHIKVTVLIDDNFIRCVDLEPFVVKSHVHDSTSATSYLMTYSLIFHEDPFLFFRKLYKKKFDEYFTRDLEETLQEEV